MEIALDKLAKDIYIKLQRLGLINKKAGEKQNQ
jgi:hypothetical protein